MKWTHDVIVIGAGSAGLTAAGGLARLGLRVALIERDAMGGECLNTGCVPSKALLAAAKRAQEVREAGHFGIRAEVPEVDFAAVMRHVRQAIAAIAPHDSVERFQDWGVEVIRGAARFTAPRSVAAADRRLSAPRVVIAVGSRPRLPPIPGLSEVPFLTNETLFDLAELPRRLLILGAGPIGIEMAQAFRRLGSTVAVVSTGRPLERDEPEAAALVRACLEREGVAFHRTDVLMAAASAEGVALTLGTGETVSGTHLLVAAGRAVALGDLDLAAAGVKWDETGIAVDRRRRTGARGVYAIGDCRRGPRFTHAAARDGAGVVMEIGFGIPAPVDDRTLPRVTYTQPELAQVGMTEAEARTSGGRLKVVRQDFADNDRAVTEGQTDGFIKVAIRNGRVVGTCIVGENAGELALPWILAMAGRTPSLWRLSGRIVPYPTRSEITKAAAFGYFERRIFSRPARLWCRGLAGLRAISGS